MELWKDIQGFEGLYRVSNQGNVTSLTHVQEYTDSIGRNVKRFKRGKVLIPSPMRNKDGYLGVTLYRNGKRYTLAVHRLVASAFVPNPQCLPQVNHKDERKINNCADNLEWCTCSYNINYGTANERRSATKRKRGVYG